MRSTFIPFASLFTLCALFFAACNGNGVDDEGSARTGGPVKQPAEEAAADELAHVLPRGVRNVVVETRFHPGGEVEGRFLQADGEAWHDWTSGSALVSRVNALGQQDGPAVVLSFVRTSTKGSARHYFEEAALILSYVGTSVDAVQWVLPREQGWLRLPLPLRPAQEVRPGLSVARPRESENFVEVRLARGDWVLTSPGREPAEPVRVQSSATQAVAALLELAEGTLPTLLLDPLLMGDDDVAEFVAALEATERPYDVHIAYPEIEFPLYEQDRPDANTPAPVVDGLASVSFRHASWPELEVEPRPNDHSDTHLPEDDRIVEDANAGDDSHPHRTDDEHGFGGGASSDDDE